MKETLTFMVFIVMATVLFFLILGFWKERNITKIRKKYGSVGASEYFSKAEKVILLISALLAIILALGFREIIR